MKVTVMEVELNDGRTYRVRVSLTLLLALISISLLIVAAMFV